jgi:hypothetical protein
MLSPVCGYGAKSFHPPAECELLLFCLSKREVPKRKRHPAYAPCEHPCPQGPRVGYGVCRQGILPCRQAGRHPCRPPCGLFLHPSAASEGPRVEQRASCAYFSEEPDQMQTESDAPLLLSLLSFSSFHRVRARRARCSTRGPCAAVRRGRQAAKRASARMPMPFRQDRSPVEKPGPGSQTCRAGARQAPSGVAFLFG